MMESKAVVTERYQFEYWDENIFLSISQIFGPSGFWYKGQSQWFFNRILLHMSESFHWDLKWGNQTLSYVETWGRTSSWIGIICFWSFWDINDLVVAGNRIDFFDGINCHNLKASYWDLGERNQATSYREVKEFENRDFPKSFGLFALRVCQDSNTRNKRNHFPKKYSYTSRRLPIEI